MSRSDIARLAFVMAGIYVLLALLMHAENALWFVFISSDALASMHVTRQQVLWAYGLPMFLLLLTGIGLILFSRSLAVRMFPDDPQDRQRVLAFPAIAYSVVGLVCFTWGVSALAAPLFQLALEGGRAIVPSSRMIAQLAEGSALILVGIALFFGSHGLARIWSRLRYAGLRRQMGLCIRCGYDLTGNTSGVCPECGTSQQV